MDSTVKQAGEDVDPPPWTYYVLRLGDDGSVIRVPIGPVPPAPPNTPVPSRPSTPPPSPPMTNGHP